MRNAELEAELEDLSSAEDFFHFFDIETEPRVVFVNRLHILQRFHDYLEIDMAGPQGGESWWDYYTRNLRRAYDDFVGSDAANREGLQGLPTTRRESPPSCRSKTC
ncbi:MAG: nitrogenase-stabilizing/protective protein NifW [Hyphomicrobiales bacterium]